MSVAVKICGLNDPEALRAAVEAGSRYVGFVFFPKSPRHLQLEQAAELSRMVPTGVRSTGLVVNPTDAALDALIARVPLDMLQLHGSESPERVREIKQRWGLRVMKALPVATADDLAMVPAYAAEADMLLFDAKPPPASTVPGGVLPGGNGLRFDWTLLQGLQVGIPWLLAGGLTPDNVAEAIRVTGAPGVDVSSGVEARPGVKDIGLIRAFIAAANGA
jgi:phosphoribosylanthranilate isomerase